MNPYTSLYLNGKQYDAKGLEELCNTELSRTDIDEWEKAIYHFIIEWINPEIPYVQVNTSGSTGEPKTIQLPKDKMILSAQMTAEYLNLAKGSTALLCLSADYIAGKMMMVRSFVNQWKLIAVEPSANPLAHLPEDSYIDITALVPMQLQNTISESTRSLEHIDKIIVGGAPVNSTILNALPKLSCQVFETFGMTETISHIAMRKLSGEKPQLYFEALDNVQLSQDDRGCLIIDAPVVQEPITTNDVVEHRDNKHFIWLGRYDNVVNSGGVKLFPEKIEKAIRDHLNLRFFFAGIQHNALGEQLVMVIEGKPFSQKELEALQLLLHQHLRKYERPRKILFLDQFIETPTGKVQRKECIQLLNE